MNIDLERQISGAVASSKRLWLLNFFGHAILGLLVYEWLWIPDSTAGSVAISAVAVLAIAILTLWLHGSTLAYFRAVHSGVENPRVVWTTLRHLPALAVCAMAVVLVSNIALLFLDYTDPVANTVASWLTLRLRRPVSPETIAAAFRSAVWIGGHFKALFLLLPWAESAVTHGFGAFGLKRVFTPLRTALNPRYWLTLLAVLVLGVFLPAILINWTPDLPSVPLETASLAIRFAAAYSCAATAWLLLTSAAAAWGKRNAKPA